ncbi:serine/threonine-protein kinase [Nocardia sp. NPDC005998]|uniref:serine/threonine-protein kinase n=1 Tax=Nocardia sp. NPDC005998 TaxID=3156894 RepID=UPI00339EB18E
MAGKFVPGTVFAGYVIERVLGSGGMGSVYVARHPRLPRHDALKVLSDDHGTDAEFRARFIREAELVARLDHPNIVAVHDRGIEDGRLWIAMQFVDGIDAAQLIRHGPAELTPERALHIIDAAARGLDEAHRVGMLHRDVKPANILLQRRPGQPDRVYVTDFGIARAAIETTALTEVGSVLATLAYAAPEQLMAGHVDYRADVYALGCTLFELLTGQKPFPRTTAVAVMQAHIQDPPPRATAVNPTLPQAIDDVIAQAMAKNPEHRHTSCGALAYAAAAAFDRRADGATLDLRPPAERRFRRRIALGASIAAAVIVLGVASALALNGNSSDVTSTGASAASSTAVTPSNTTLPPTPTGAAGAASWGGHNYMVRVLPELLPKTPADSGYQGMRCVAVDADKRPIDVNQAVGAMTYLSCNGDRNPLELLIVACNANRTSSKIEPYTDAAVAGEEQWERPSGRGRVIWQDVTGPSGRPAGAVQVEFADGGRSFCQLRVFGGESGRDLLERWWRNAPV